MKKLLCIAFALSLCLSLLPGCAPAVSDGDNSADLAGTYDITLWVSEKEGVTDLFNAQIKAFEAANPGITINARVEGVTEADTGSRVIADVATAPDLFSFAQDQLARLVQAAALAKPGKAAQDAIISGNDAGSVAAAKVAGEIYAYPMTGDNGYYMYYDTGIISQADTRDLSKLIAACETNNRKFRFALEDAWYTSSFFFATGCHSNWTTDANGNFTAVDDTFNSEKGLIAMKGMQLLTRSPAYDSDADKFTDAGVIVTGTWNAEAAKIHFGDRLGAAKLPTFTVDGKTYQLGSFSGYKLIGVKPQSDARRGAVLQLLAQYLTNEENQLARFNRFGWGPSNIKAQADEAVKANISLSALAAQNAFATPQGQIAGLFWDNAKLLGAVAKTAKSDAELQKGLDDYTKAISAYVRPK